jgi:type I restriction enzyme, S subunit
MTMNEIKLKELVKKVIRGIQVRPPIDQNVTTIEVINIKDLQEGRVDVSALEKREIMRGKDPKIASIQQNDLLIAIKGSQLKAAVAGREAEGYPISSNIISFRLDTSKTNPEVVAAYLNGPDGQQKLRTKSRGSTIPSISQTDLLDVTIPLPPLEKQLLFRDYLESVHDYLMALKREEQVIKDIRSYIIQQQLR